MTSRIIFSDQDPLISPLLNLLMLKRDRMRQPWAFGF